MDKKICIIVTLLCVFLLLFSSVSFADKIYLKNGKVYDGKLLGRSEKRFLFSVDIEGVSFRMSFFPDEVEKLELGKETVEEQIPYLKEVESFKVKVSRDKPKFYEMSLYKESQIDAKEDTFTEEELKNSLTKEEAEYYDKFNYILKKYVDKLNFIQNTYSSLTIATREDFAKAKTYMDELYFELGGLFIPRAFEKSHRDYLESLRAGFAAFSALERGILEEASKQFQISETLRQRSMLEFRRIILERKAAALNSLKKQ